MCLIGVNCGLSKRTDFDPQAALWRHAATHSQPPADAMLWYKHADFRQSKSTLKQTLYKGPIALTHP